MWLQKILKRRLGDGAGIVGDRRGRDDRENFQALGLGEAGLDEPFQILRRHMAARLDKPARQMRQRGETRIDRQVAGADRLDIGLRQPLLEGQHGMERDGPVAVVGDGIGQQHGLDFSLGESCRNGPVETGPGRL